MAKTNFQRKLEDKLNEAMGRRIENLAGGGAEDYPQYRETVGYLEALKEAIRISEEIESENQ